LNKADHKIVNNPISNILCKTTPEKAVKNSGIELDGAKNSAPAIKAGILNLVEIDAKLLSTHSEGKYNKYIAANTPNIAAIIVIREGFKTRLNIPIKRKIIVIIFLIIINIQNGNNKQPMQLYIYYFYKLTFIL
jgi:hypothetical protein